MSPTRTSISSTRLPSTSMPPPSCSLTLSAREQAGPTYLRRIKAVILESPQMKLSLREIYSALEAQPDFLSSRRKEDNGWRNTVRNLLSLSPGFEKVKGEKSAAPGRGAYWTVAEDAAETFTRTERLRTSTRGKNRQTGSGPSRSPNRGGGGRGGKNEEHHPPPPDHVASFTLPSFLPHPLPSDTPPPPKPLPFLFPLPSVNPLSSPTLHVLLQDLHHPTIVPLLSPPLSSGSSCSFSPPPVWVELEEEVMGSTSPSGGWVFCERVSLMRSTLHDGESEGGDEGEWRISR